jgi:hypothetical protein
MQFPLYRKYINNRSYFKIVDNDHFVELKLTGSMVEKHLFEAKILPDRNFIQDMISLQGGHWEAIGEAEYDAIERKIIG